VSRRGAGLVLAIAFAILAPLQCRKAEGVAADPMDAEAEEAFIGYLRIDTTNPPGNETAGAQYLGELLRKNGIEAKLLGPDPKRQAIYARLESSSHGSSKDDKALLLLSHIDVVPAVTEEWTKPPFGGSVSGGYIWGRGAIDMKSMTIAHLMSLVDLKRRGKPLQRDVIFLATPDEELGGRNGVRMLLEKHPELFADVGFVLNEGGYNETIVDKVLYWAVETHQKVPLWLRITSEGMAGHGAMAGEDGGATAKLVRALARIDALETPYRFSPDIRKMFEEVSRAKGEHRGRHLRAVREPLDVPRIEKELGAGYRNLLRDTIAITRISAGTTVNVIPPRASADVDIRLLPDSSSEEMRKRIEDAVGKDGKVEVLLSSEPVAASSSDTELYRVLAKVLRESEPGSQVAPVVGVGTTDSRYFRARGIPAYGIMPFKVNYYDADSVHGADERIRARFFVEGVQLMRRIVRELCAGG
jgi:acetylornithine deacetylase/succinyl-diaminopimelate desuccinylase-like protein